MAACVDGCDLHPADDDDDDDGACGRWMMWLSSGTFDHHVTSHLACLTMADITIQFIYTNLACCLLPAAIRHKRPGFLIQIAVMTSSSLQESDRDLFLVQFGQFCK